MTNKIIGVTGRVGVGKTFLVDHLKAKLTNIVVIDLDKVGHKCLLQDDIKQQLKMQFGITIFNQAGQVDRSILGSIVFKDKHKLLCLNKIVHPEIFKQVNYLISLQTNKVIVIVGALIHEINLAGCCHEIIAVINDSKQRNRLLGSKIDIEKMQLNDLEYSSVCSQVFYNSFNLKAQDKFTELINKLI